MTQFFCDDNLKVEFKTWKFKYQQPIQYIKNTF